MDEIERVQRRGFGNRVGFGRRPALLVVDFSRSFTSPASSLGADMAAEIGEANRLIQSACCRSAGFPLDDRLSRSRRRGGCLGREDPWPV